MKWWMFLVLLLGAACVASEGQERFSPTATSTQIMDLSGAVVEQDADGLYYITDQGDGCEYHETTPDIPSTPFVINGVEHMRVSLFDPDDLERCPNGWDYDTRTGELFPLVPAAPAPSGGEIVVSSVVRELAAGKGCLFSDQGEVALRGFEDPVRLYQIRWQD